MTQRHDQQAVFTLQKFALTGCVALGGSLHWTVGNQQGGTLEVWTFQNLDRTVQLGGLSWLIPAAWFQTLNPIMILAFAPIVTGLWSRGAPGSPVMVELRRMALGSLMLPGSFAFLATGTMAGGDAPSWLWLLLATAPLTLGEIYLDSMGQGFFCRQAPAGYLSTFLSVWLLTSTVGYVTAGWLGALWGPVQPPQFFALSALLALGSVLVIAAARRLVPRVARA